MQQAIRSQRVVTPEGTRPACVYFENGLITAVADYETPAAGVAVIEAGSDAVLPGLVDSHVHINDPGRSEWEGFVTATKAAAAGGYTCVVDMPLNSIPATTSVEALRAKREAAGGQCRIDYAFWGGAVPGNEGEIGALASAGVCGFKSFLVHPGVEEFAMVGEAELRRLMPAIARTGLPLLVHAESPEPIRTAEKALRAAGARWCEYKAWLESRPDEAEVEAIALMIRLCREYRCRVHIVHLATAQALPAIENARREGLPLTVETCPHYLYFESGRIPEGATEFKCAPPIRSAANRFGLWHALRSGVIDLIATDHSPCPPAMKRRDAGDFSAAWGGIASLSVSLPAVWTAGQDFGMKLDDVARRLSSEPAKLAGMARHKGAIAPAFDADFAVFDPEEERTVGGNDLYFRHPVSPYVGERLRGVVRKTFVRGRCVFDGSGFPDEPAGREYRPPEARIK